MYLCTSYNWFSCVPDGYRQSFRAAKKAVSNIPHAYVDGNSKDYFRIMRMASKKQRSRGGVSIFLKNFEGQDEEKQLFNIAVHAVAYNENHRKVLANTFLEHFGAQKMFENSDTMGFSIPKQNGMNEKQLQYFLEKLVLLSTGQNFDFEIQHNEVLNDDTAFIFDLDGTLYQTVGAMQEVVIPEETRQAIIDLYHVTGGAVAIATGRDLKFVDDLFGFKLPVIAEHGAHLRLKSDEDSYSQANIEQLDELINYLKTNFENKEGFKVEVKPHSSTLHIPKELVDESLKDLKTDILEKFTDFQVKGAVNAIEFIPKNVDKGIGIEKLMEQPVFKDKKPIYFGDSEGDIPALKALYKFFGRAVSIGNKTSFWGRDNSLFDERYPVSGIKESAQSKLIRIVQNYTAERQNRNNTLKFPFPTF